MSKYSALVLTSLDFNWILFHTVLSYYRNYNNIIKNYRNTTSEWKTQTFLFFINCSDLLSSDSEFPVKIEIIEICTSSVSKYFCLFWSEVIFDLNWLRIFWRNFLLATKLVNSSIVVPDVLYSIDKFHIQIFPLVLSFRIIFRSNEFEYSFQSWISIQFRGWMTNFCIETNIAFQFISTSQFHHFALSSFLCSYYSIAAELNFNNSLDIL